MLFQRLSQKRTYWRSGVLLVLPARAALLLLHKNYATDKDDGAGTLC
jgi:hypothetical protein